MPGRRCPRDGRVLSPHPIPIELTHNRSSRWAEWRLAIDGQTVDTSFLALPRFASHSGPQE